MLIAVTTRCDMGCSHCMASCTPSGEDMAIDNFRLAIDEISKVDKIVLLTGGEPLLHPDIWDMIDYARKSGLFVILISNGYYLGLYEAECETRLKEPVSRFLVQVTNDPRYYPKRIPDMKVIWRLEKYGLGFTDRIPTLSALGRAKDNGLESHGRNFPMCANSILCANQTPDLRTAIAALMRFGKNCHFTIMPNMDVMLSECRKIRLGNLGDPGWAETVYARLLWKNQTKERNVFCDECGKSNQDILRMCNFMGRMH